jgi:hypothetical protein
VRTGRAGAETGFKVYQRRFWRKGNVAEQTHLNFRHFFSFGSGLRLRAVSRFACHRTPQNVCRGGSVLECGGKRYPARRRFSRSPSNAAPIGTVSRARIGKTERNLGAFALGNVVAEFSKAGQTFNMTFDYWPLIVYSKYLRCDLRAMQPARGSPWQVTDNGVAKTETRTRAGSAFGESRCPM